MPFLRSSHPEVFCKVLFRKIQRKTPVPDSLFVMLSYFRSQRIKMSSKKKLKDKWKPENFLSFQVFLVNNVLDILITQSYPKQLRYFTKRYWGNIIFSNVNIIFWFLFNILVDIKVLCWYGNLFLSTLSKCLIMIIKTFRKMFVIWLSFIFYLWVQWYKCNFFQLAL